MPTDAVSAPPPGELMTISSGAASIYDTAGSGDWAVMSTTLDSITDAWTSYQAANDIIPIMLEPQMNDALEELTDAIDELSPSDVQQAALNTVTASLDLQLRHKLPAEIDLSRFDLWVNQILIDAAADEPGDVAGDVTTLEWVWDRFAHTIAASDARLIEEQLTNLRSAADNKDTSSAEQSAVQLSEIVAGQAD